MSPTSAEHPEPPDRTPPALCELRGEILVVDTDSSFVFLGRLEGADSEFLRLSHVDVHEMGKASLSKERYIHEARRLGVRDNRKLTWVNMARVVSLARLEDVIAF